ncbi:MAG: DUF134 domain-containing protein [Candidatus Bathyarchaeia archaeon]
MALSPAANRLMPIPMGDAEPIHLEPAEVEALRLIDLEGLSFEAAGERMGVSRNTVWRLVDGARKKLARAIIEGREVIIGGRGVAEGAPHRLAMRARVPKWAMGPIAASMPFGLCAAHIAA